MIAFEEFHPAALSGYFVCMGLITVLSFNPVLIGLSLGGAVLYAGFLYEKKEYKKSLWQFLGLWLLIAVSNPLFSHNGKTVLFYLNDNPITFESFLYGVSAGGMIFAVAFWCKCLQKIFTTDKILYLFGKGIPKLSIILSMAIRFLPAYRRQAEQTADVQKLMGMERQYGKTGAKLRVYDSVFGWAVENSVDTADAMNARGFGCGKRTNYSIFYIHLYDILLLAYLLGYGIYYVVENKWTVFRYYPDISGIKVNAPAVVFYIMTGGACLMPVICQIGNVVWMQKVFHSGKGKKV